MNSLPFTFSYRSLRSGNQEDYRARRSSKKNWDATVSLTLESSVGDIQDVHADVTLGLQAGVLLIRDAEHLFVDVGVVLP